jgi:hypothetical protein
MSKLMTMIAAVAFLALWAGSMARADDDKLVVVQDESSMEQTIERYLKDKHQLIINEKFLKPDDLYLELPMKGEDVPGMPAYRIQIDTQALNRNDSGLILERGVRIQLLTGIKVPADKWVAAMRAINDFNRRKTFSATYVDEDGEIVLDWTLNVLSEGLATEYVFDTVARESKLWKELYPDATAALK